MNKVLIPLFSLVLFISCDSKDEAIGIIFKKHVLYDQFVSEGIAAGDVNHDGLLDIMAGPFWFEAPDWKSHEIRTPKPFDITKGWSDSFLNFAIDVNQDGWIDLVSIDFPGTGAYWYENPQNAAGHWNRYMIDSTACNESPMMADINMDGKQDLVFGSGNKEMKWFSLPDDPGNLWESNALSNENAAGTNRFSHGLGSGDINGDGRDDVMVIDGWWEAPLDRTSAWTWHKVSLGEPCSQMHVYDFDADGDNDVISCSAHNYGIWWHEHIREADGEITFKRHLIDSSFSQSHGAELTDMNRDGLPDLITGKRYFAHNGKDPGGLDPQVIYWYEMQRDENNNPGWKPHLIDDSSGIGLQVIIEDMNDDGLKDILISNKKGIFYFEGNEEEEG